MAITRTPFKKTMTMVTGSAEVHAAPGAGKRLGVVRILAANSATFGLLEDIQFHWGAKASGDYAAVGRLDTVTMLNVAPGQDEDHPEEGPLNVALNVTAGATAVSITVWGYVEEET